MSEATSISANTGVDTSTDASLRAKQRKQWNYLPPEPLAVPPLWYRPWRKPLAVAWFIARPWRPTKERFWFLMIALVLWFFFTPPLETMADFHWQWMSYIWARNFIITLAIVGGAHLWFYVLRGQNAELQYDARPFVKGSKRFLFGDQVRDNMFWTLTGGVGAWSAYECLLLWGFASGFSPLLGVGEGSPWAWVWLVVLFLLIPFWTGVHFYAQHRLLHWKPLYKRIHSWHHNNVNIGPWSGLAMHPAEHVILFTDCLLYLFVLSHPVHAFFNLLIHGLGAPLSHTGFEGFRLRGRKRLDVADFYHHLHHRYFDCNYGSPDTPWDYWMGTFHDGSEAGDKAMVAVRRKKAERQRNKKNRKVKA